MAEREIVEKMLNVIRHRGTDSTRVYKGGKFFAGVVASNLSQPRGNGFAKEGDL
jgi:asparagine synthetase B (glutamine-hydrolysing)